MKDFKKVTKDLKKLLLLEARKLNLMIDLAHSIAWQEYKKTNPDPSVYDHNQFPLKAPKILGWKDGETGKYSLQMLRDIARSFEETLKRVTED